MKPSRLPSVARPVRVGIDRERTIDFMGDKAGVYATPMMVRDIEVTCREFVELVTEYWEGALPEDRMELVEEHLVMCDWCKTYLEQMEATVAALPEAGRNSAGIAASAAGMVATAVAPTARESRN